MKVQAGEIFFGFMAALTYCNVGNSIMLIQSHLIEKPFTDEKEGEREHDLFFFLYSNTYRVHFF